MADVSGWLPNMIGPLDLQAEGATFVTRRATLNFTGGNVTVTDDAVNERTDIDFVGAHTIKNEGTALTTRGAIDFVGDGITASDDAGGDRTIVTVSIAPTVIAARITALDANHLHAWELTETSGSSFADTGSSASKVSLPIVNTANVQLGTPGLLGACPLFGLTTTPSAAVGSAAALVSAFSDLPTTNITLEAWVRQTSVSGASGRFVVSCDFANAANLQMYVGSTANDNYSTVFRTSGTFGDGSTGTLTDFAASTRLIGQWVHLAITYDGSFFRQYVNGEMLKKQAATGTISWSYTNGPAPKIAIAADISASSGTHFVGQMSRVRLSNIVRTQTALRAVYAAGMGI